MLVRAGSRVAAAEFIQRIPAYISRLQFIVTDFDPSWLSRTLGVETSGLRGGFGPADAGGGLPKVSSSRPGNSVEPFSTSPALFVITPVVAFYMLLDLDRMVARIDSLIPRTTPTRCARSPGTWTIRSPGFVRAGNTLPRARHLLMRWG